MLIRRAKGMSGSLDVTFAPLRLAKTLLRSGDKNEECFHIIYKLCMNFTPQILHFLYNQPITTIARMAI